MYTELKCVQNIKMNWTVIDYYVERNNISEQERNKIYDFINLQNRIREGNHKIVGGYLTKTELRCVTAYGYPENYPISYLGINWNKQ